MNRWTYAPGLLFVLCFSLGGGAVGAMAADDASVKGTVADPLGAHGSVEVALPIGPLEESVSVTSAATDVLRSQTGAPVTVLDSKTLEALGKTDVLEALRLVPAASLGQTGGKGGVTSMFIRGDLGAVAGVGTGWAERPAIALRQSDPQRPDMAGRASARRRKGIDARARCNIRCSAGLEACPSRQT